MRCGQVAPADRAHLRAWLARFGQPGEVAFAVEACTGWRYVTGELQRAGMEAHLAQPADTAAARGRKRRAKTDRADARLQRDLLVQDRHPLQRGHLARLPEPARLTATLVIGQRWRL